jgi:hypothetical protein
MPKRSRVLLALFFAGWAEAQSASVVIDLRIGNSYEYGQAVGEAASKARIADGERIRVSHPQMDSHAPGLRETQARERVGRALGVAVRHHMAGGLGNCIPLNAWEFGVEVGSQRVMGQELLHRYKSDFWTLYDAKVAAELQRLKGRSISR